MKKRTRSFKKKLRKAFYKSHSKPAKSNIKPKTRVSLGVGFPKRLTTVHKYTKTVQLSAATGAMATYRFLTNGLYQPDVTAGSGHQPMFFDQFGAIYSSYNVIGSKMTVKFIPNNFSTTATTANHVGGFVDENNTSVVTTVDGVSEQTLGKTGIVTLNLVKPYVMTFTWSAKKSLGGSILAQDDNTGSNTGNPAGLWYYNLVTQATDGTSTAVSIMIVHIEYITVWHNLKEIAQS